MDTKQIKSLMQDFDKSGLSKFRLKNEILELEFEKTFTTSTVVNTPVITQQPQQMISTEAKSETFSGEAILSPMVGTFYASPSPDSAPFVKKGDMVKKGQVLGILEAMKIMNELEAEFDCKIIDILVSDGRPVEYDMPLFEIKKI